jgi:hypothetical protein
VRELTTLQAFLSGSVVDAAVAALRPDYRALLLAVDGIEPGPSDAHTSSCAGPPRLVRATGSEPFDTTAGGETVVEHPDAGEVVWCDGAGTTCRRWKWRQARRTQLTDGRPLRCSSGTPSSPSGTARPAPLPTTWSSS